MKIAFYSHLFLPNIGGVEVQIHNLATEMVRAGHDVSVVVEWSKWSALRKWRLNLSYRVLPLLPRLSGIAMRSLERRRERTWLVGWQLRCWQKRYGFDVWHVHGGYPSGVLTAGQWQGMAIPSLLTCHGEDINTLPEIGYGIRRDPIRDRQFVTALGRYDGLIAVSPSIANKYVEAGIGAERIFSVPNGIDIGRIKRTAADVAAVRAAHGVPCDRPLLLTVGRNHPIKGYELIPRIAQKLAQAGRAFTWLLVGRGTQHVVDEAGRLGVGDSVRALNIGSGGKHRLDSLPDEEAIRLYKAADLFVFTSRMESFGLAVVEAMAAGLPVIAGDVPGVRDVVQHGQTGWLNAGRDPVAWAEGIEVLLDDPSLRRKLAERAKRAAERYELRRVAEECIEVYRCVAAAKRNNRIEPLWTTPSP